MTRYRSTDHTYSVTPIIWTRLKDLPFAYKAGAAPGPYDAIRDKRLFSHSSLITVPGPIGSTLVPLRRASSMRLFAIRALMMQDSSDFQVEYPSLQVFMTRRSSRLLGFHYP